MSSKKRGAKIKNTVRKATETGSRPNKPNAAGERLSAYNLPNDHMERFLVTGEYSGLIEDYFGPEEYREIRELVQKAKRRGGGPRVFMLPGMMGSKLGKRRPFPIPVDVVWFDPLGIGSRASCRRVARRRRSRRRGGRPSRPRPWSQI